MLPVSERRICKVLGQSRTTQRYQRKPREDEEALTERIIELATRFGRYGYRRITALLKAEGWRVNHKRVERIWRRGGLRVPSKQPKRGRLWFNDGSCVRLRPEHRNHVWTYDFVYERTHDGRQLRLLTVLDEYTRESLAIKTGRKHSSAMVSSPRSPSKTIPIFSSDENLRRVLRLISRTTFSGSLCDFMVHSFGILSLPEVSINLMLETVSLQLAGYTWFVSPRYFPDTSTGRQPG